MTLLSALSGVVVGGLQEGLRQRKAFEREKNWERRQLRRQKLERIAETANEISAALSSQLAYLVKHASLTSLENLDEAQARVVYEDLKQGAQDVKSLPIPYLEMLVAFYASELAERTRSLGSGKATLGRAAASALMEKADAKRGEALANYIMTAQEVQAECRELVNDAARLVQEGIA